MTNKSSPVSSNQTDVHEDLEQIVKKHLKHPYKKPFREFSQSIFDQIDQIKQNLNQPIILDSGCGTGESSMFLSKLHNDALIIGIDKSEKRLEKFLQGKNFYHKDNLILARADVIDIWRLAIHAKWNLRKHFLLYPNPWPKKDQLKRRWHGHPVFPEMVNLCGNIELRTNWKLYAEEFNNALEIVTGKHTEINSVEINDFISPFEKKYYESEHELYRVLLT